MIVKGGADQGKDFETLVFLQLKKKYGKVCYWKEKGEVDFVVEGPKGIVPVQVSVGEALERHEKSLQEFYRAFPHAQESVFVNLKNFEAWSKSLKEEEPR